MLPSRTTGPLQILIVEDNPLHAQALRLGLKRLGYGVIGVAATPDEARRLMRAEPPDLLLLDIHLALEADAAAADDVSDGIGLAAELVAHRPTPLIFLTSLADDATFRRAQVVAPAAFLLKPFDPDTLRRAIELAVVRASVLPMSETAAATTPDSDAVVGLLPEVLFVRHAGRLERVALADVVYLASDRAYCDLFLAVGSRYSLHTSLGEIEERLPPGRFVRIHRSYIVAWAAIEAVDTVAMEVRMKGGARLPLSRSYRDELLQTLPQLG